MNTRRQVRQTCPRARDRVISFGAGKGGPRSRTENLAAGDDNAVGHRGRAKPAAGLVQRTPNTPPPAPTTQADQYGE